MTVQLLPTRARYLDGEAVTVAVRGLRGTALVQVLHLGEGIANASVSGDGVIDFGPLRPGGYGVELKTDGRVVRTAVDVAGTGYDAMRYGFVVDYRPDRDVTATCEHLRRLHLTDVQFYDWAYRHADLLGGGQTYTDALAQPISLATVRHLIEGIQAAGARALGYAAVYAVGNDEWLQWEHRALLTPAGSPYSLGDFLRLVDPASADWLAHFVGELADAASRLGFDGFHLDQYGYPKHAIRADGTEVDVAESFAGLIGAARAQLPSARLVFNNVNDFPTWRTGPCAQDAVYVEVWPPHTTLGHLARVVERAHAVADGKPVVIAAYQHVYDTATAAAADLATSFTMATLFSHAATQLLCGESDRILIDPYYVRNHPAQASTRELLTRWYDYAVEHGELLYDPSLHDLTGALAGSYNDDCDIAFDDRQLSEWPEPGRIWRRITGSGNRLIMHLINLTDQADCEWDSPRRDVTATGPGTLRIRRTGDRTPRVRYADPDAQAHLVDVPVRIDGDHAVAQTPPLYVWQSVVIDLDAPANSDGPPGGEVVDRIRRKGPA